MSQLCKCRYADYPGNAHCRTCCVSFSGDSWFDAHLVRRSGVGVVAHLTPEAMGLVHGKRGWGAGTREPLHQAEIRKRVKALRAQALAEFRVAVCDHSRTGNVCDVHGRKCPEDVRNRVTS